MTSYIAYVSEQNLLEDESGADQSSGHWPLLASTKKVVISKPENSH